MRGPGSFVPAFLDELWLIREEAGRKSEDWFAKRAKVQAIQAKELLPVG